MGLRNDHGLAIGDVAPREDANLWRQLLRLALALVAGVVKEKRNRFEQGMQCAVCTLKKHVWFSLVENWKTISTIGSLRRVHVLITCFYLYLYVILANLQVTNELGLE